MECGLCRNSVNVRTGSSQQAGSAQWAANVDRARAALRDKCEQDGCACRPEFIAGDFMIPRAGAHPGGKHTRRR